MSALPFSEDILFIVASFLPSLQDHLALSQTSRPIRRALYGRDENWRMVLRSFGYGRPATDLESEPTPCFQLVVSIVGHRCSALVITGVDPGSEGVLSKIWTSPVCDISRKDWSRTFSNRRPLTPTAVAKAAVRLEVCRRALDPSHQNLFTRDPSTKDSDVIALDPLDFDPSDHPQLSAGFATRPAVTKLLIKLAGRQLEVVNADGVTVQDCCVASEREKDDEAEPATRTGETLKQEAAGSIVLIKE